MISCASKAYNTVSFVDRDRFMGRWYVQAGRFTYLEKNVHNGIEIYTWNDKENRIDIDFSYNQGSLTGPLKKIPQKGWIENTKTNAHWKVSPMWPLKFDFLVIALDPDYTWTAIGVPDQKYLWVMTRERIVSKETIQKMLTEIEKTGYRTDDIVFVPHTP